ncbi:sensor histidine kinase [Taibaiella chishuiensis]|uniref:Two component regulator with propeller domain n=1 Tax=Taibaiella chishuiensis TaxID=1434707 RepID=A0A2P8D9T0_9BACT|nr:histidine kinase [Taibaiella chishuiensis]PSK93980.1 two component regulator with propeller domain [Taibaiella chishuiensis]
MPRRSYYLLLVLALVSAINKAWGQLPPMQHFTVDDGLPSNLIYSINVDHQGYLWFSTNKGISRFNGTWFQNFSTFDGMPDNEVFAAMPDHKNRLWLSNYSGQLCYMEHNVFHTPANTPWLRLPFRSAVSGMYPQTDSSLNAVFGSVHQFVNIRNHQLRIIKTPMIPKRLCYVRSLSNRRFRLFYADFCIDIDTLGKAYDTIKYTNHKFYQPINIKPNGSYMLLADDGIYSSDLHKLYNLRNTRFNIGYSVGANIIANDCFVGLLNGFTINDSIHIRIGEHVNFFEQDNKGNIWIATRGNGIYKLSKHFNHITEYNKQYKDQVLYARYVGNKLFYVTNEGSLYEFSNGVSHLRHQNYSDYRNNAIYFARSNFLIDNNGNFTQFYAYQTVFITGLLAGKPQVHRFYSYWDNNIKEIIYNGKYIYYVPFSDNIRQFTYTDFFKKGVPHYEDIVTIPPESQSHILSRAVNPADSSLWLSHTLGVYRIKEKEITRQSQFRNISFRQFVFHGPYLLGITEDNHLVVCNINSGRVDTVTTQDYIWETIYPIDRNRCLVSTNNLYCVLTFHPPTDQGRARYTIQPIENSFIPRQADCVAADSTYCFFFKKGTITKVGTSVLFGKMAPPTPVLQLLRTSAGTHTISPEITIPYSESRNISLLFDNISFSGKEASSEYSITEQGRENWRPIAGNEINLNRPGFGSFIIKVRSRTPSSGYSQPAILHLIILRPFWASWWFILTGIAVSIVLFYFTLLLLTRRRLAKKQKEHDSEMKYQQAEYKALNALMNPHFIFNSLNNIQGLINKNEKRIANAYLVVFSDLIRQNMHNISRGFISLQDEINLVENYLNLEKLRFKEFINYDIIVDDEVEADFIMIPPLMIQPLVENAVKHGLLPKQSEQNRVTIRVFEEQDLLYIEIIDNGVGLTYAREHLSNLHESFGLSNLQKRAEYLKKIQKRKLDLEITELKDAGGQILGTRARIIMELDEQS